MDALVEYLQKHAHNAHWYIFGGILLAGFNVPISIDLVVILAALLASSFVPDHLPHLYCSILFGCYLSACIAYWVGRTLSTRLMRFKLFNKMLSEERMEKVTSFFSRYGIWTFIIGRFIPFGVRNGLFMTCGISKMPFHKFLLRDGVACFIWVTIAFATFFLIGQNYQTLWASVKTFNLLIFTAFSVTVITSIWYKLKKKKKTSES